MTSGWALVYGCALAVDRFPRRSTIAPVQLSPAGRATASMRHASALLLPLMPAIVDLAF